MAPSLATRVSQTWLRNFLAKEDVSFEDFKQFVHGRRFRHPETERQDLFTSLPSSEQARIFQQWKQQKSPQPPQRSDARGLVPIDKKKARELSDSIAKSLTEIEFPDNDSTLAGNPPRLWPHHAPAIQIQGVKGNKFWLPVEVTIAEAPKHNWTVGRKYVAGGAVIHRAVGPKGKPHPFKILIKLDKSRTPRELKQDSKRVSDEIYQLLIHELTHAADVLPSQDQQQKQDRKTPGDEATKYHNKPEEVRAFKRQIAEEFDTELRRRYKSEEDPDWIEQTADTAASVLRTSQTWERIRKDLTPENRRLILRTVADTLLRYKEERGGKTARTQGTASSKNP